MSLNREPPVAPNEPGTPFGQMKLAAPTAIQVPCGTCIGCQTTRAQHWALRCHLEAQHHQYNAVTTLTYDDEHLPPHLAKEHVQLWMKRFRKAHEQPVRHFTAGEYGERYGRPHYHVILFGVRHKQRHRRDYFHPLIQATWGLGATYTDNASLEAMAYIAGYVNKKLAWGHGNKKTMIDPTTGEVTWEPPFQLMSKRPGIGAHAKQHYNSWRLYAVNDGHKISVPRYYKTAYEDHATPNEKEETEYHKYLQALTRHENTEQQLETKERIHYARQRAKAALRKYE